MVIDRRIRVSGGKRPRPLAYYGGKYFQAKWINSILPYKYKSVYFEPFFGMGHILLNRDITQVEVVNDLNNRLVNYWRMVRDKKNKLSQLIEETPYSREEYKWALKNIDNPKLSKIKRALAYHILIWMSIRSSDDDSAGEKDFQLSFAQGGSHFWPKERLKVLAERMRGVRIENRDALFLLDKVRDKENIVIYCDPPYYTSNNKGFKKFHIDIIDLKDVLLSQKGKVAISGQDKEWNMLKWNKHKKQARITAALNNKRNMKRIDCLWTNF